MNAGPSIVRRATPDDREGIWKLFHLLHEENGVFALSEPKVNFLLDRILHPERVAEGDTGQRGFMGVIGSVGKLEGFILMVLGALWYSDDIIFEELANFVHPDYRRSSHSKALISYSRNMADKVGIPLVVGIVSNKRTAAKIRLYRQQLPEAGSFFLYNLAKA